MRTKINQRIRNGPDKGKSWLKTLAALIPFITFGLGLILNELPREWAIPPGIHALSGYLLIGTIGLLPFGFCIGWIQSFPRWSYPYVGQFLLMSLYMMQQPTPNFLAGKELLGWQAWILLLIVAAVSFLVTRSLKPLKRFFSNIRGDWTVLTFGLYGFMPLIIAVIYDEMDRLFSLYFMITLTLLMAGTVIATMQSSKRNERIRALVIGILLTISTAVLGPAWFWFDEMKANPWPTIIAGIVIYLFMFSPALIGFFRKPVQTV